MKNLLFSPITIQDVVFKNRVFMSPMCQYSAQDGLVNEWHITHYLSRAIGGVGGIIVEASAVEPRGRITPYDLGIYNSEQKDAFSKLVELIKKLSPDTKIGIQLAHAGRKGSKDKPWLGEKLLTKQENGYETIAPSPIAFDEDSSVPKQMDKKELNFVKESFVNSAKMAKEAGFDFIELHMAHGYLSHEFLSPLSNIREDEYGGNLQNRLRYPLEIAKSVKEEINNMPLFVRVSATDWAKGGWDLESSAEFAKQLKLLGVDLIDVSSGGLVSYAQLETDFGYQTFFSSTIKHKANVLTSAVGLIANAYQAEHILSTKQADIIVLGRALLSDPYWCLHAAKALNVDIDWPNQYLRAKHI
ncbi:NADH-dependent flavin oxidoreductase [Desulfurella amilsii]|uniref:NADH-dependent flavin oxidoreductase n=1 Tax=Desulfurella amilsii TaxID=1562698 RepID=A0A1X4XW25_9BACT|nr:NADH:flavin oxidoreductase/NADH oxidase [Desulfurella amilsii]OSS41724.1 NADH-dependent flavin oxidoreductase [Desulfurella amilsii]